MKQDLQINLEKARNQKLTARVKMNTGRTVHLHSSVDPEGEAQEWLKRTSITESTLFLVLGMGLGYHVEALLNVLPASSYVLVICTQEEIDLVRQMNTIHPLQWLQSEKFFYLPITSKYGMSVALANLMADKIVKKLSVCKHFPSMVLAAETYVQVEQELIPSVEMIMGINFNVVMTSGYHFFKNYWLNFSLLAAHHGISVLKDTFQSIPVIVVAAGPSLDKNIHLLKECQDYAIIVAAGTAIGPLTRQGIQPDFFIVSDVLPENYNVLKEYLNTGAALVSSVYTNHKVVEEYPTSVYFFKAGHDYSAGTLSRLFNDIMGINQTISVATGAVDFAVQCGAKQVILIGQDLAYSSEKEYAEGTKGAGYAMLKRILIPGCDGQMVESNPTFQAVIGYYNQYVAMTPEVQFINATEGGALIENMQQQTLRQVIDRVLPRKKVDKSFIHRFSKRKKVPTKILGFLYRLEKDVRGLFCQVQEFIQSEAVSEDVKTEELSTNEEDLRLKLQKIKEFYTHITTTPGYCYIDIFMRPRLSLVLFKTQDGMMKENEYISYCTLLFDVQEILKQLLGYTEKNIKDLQEKRGGKLKCKKPSR